MSYMNDDTDPFGIPYPKETNTPIKQSSSKEQIVEYNLKEYREFLDQKNEFKKTIQYLEKDIDNAEVYLTKRIGQICDGTVLSVEFKRNKVIVVVGSISLTSLLKLKKELDLKDIIIRGKETQFYLDLLW